MTQFLRRYVWIGGLLTLAACATSPEPDYYTLAPVPGTAMPQIAVTVKLVRPVIAGYLDRPDFVRQDGDYQLSIDETSQWAAPLDRMIEQILAADLRQRLPDGLIVTDQDIGTSPRYVVTLDLQRFNRDGGRSLLRGALTLNDSRAVARPLPIELDLNDDSGSSPDDVAAGLSRLTGQVADRLAADIEKLQKADLGAVQQ